MKEDTEEQWVEKMQTSHANVDAANKLIPLSLCPGVWVCADCTLVRLINKMYHEQEQGVSIRDISKPEDKIVWLFSCVKDKMERYGERQTLIIHAECRKSVFSVQVQDDTCL